MFWTHRLLRIRELQRKYPVIDDKLTYRGGEVEARHKLYTDATKQQTKAVDDYLNLLESEAKTPSGGLLTSHKRLADLSMEVIIAAIIHADLRERFNVTYEELLRAKGIWYEHVEFATWARKLSADFKILHDIHYDAWTGNRPMSIGVMVTLLDLHPPRSLATPAPYRPPGFYPVMSNPALFQLSDQWEHAIKSERRHWPRRTSAECPRCSYSEKFKPRAPNVRPFPRKLYPMSNH